MFLKQHNQLGYGVWEDLPPKLEEKVIKKQSSL